METPLLSAAANSDPQLASFDCRYNGPGAPADGRLWLQTSPEFAMKRLLAAGSGSIYQLCRAFRADERGRRHNPEFTILEWYRVGFDHYQLMDEVAELATLLLGPHPEQRLTYRDAFLRYAEVDPFTADEADLRACAERWDVPYPKGLSGHDNWLDLLLSCIVTPALAAERFTFITDFPASQAALARIREGSPPVAERFELFIGGMEIANGFHELTDPTEQQMRFAAEQAARTAQGLPAPTTDRRLLAALAAGLPACAGVAVGLDRLIMLVCGANAIDEVLAFPIERA
ncbi:EF-P lysine aminoacylase EpmA [Alkalilimnicola ehrlichii]|uniref:EF-P lysine aminoacylase EpmA n=1 Tax=Alkalilimnicola ehrlichii TaxID=351052 RepID=UPI0028694269|nr:EF-P lysine aminoacylase EpmA [Alkalilimnicola ehrlichii]